MSDMTERRFPDFSDNRRAYRDGVKRFVEIIFLTIVLTVFGAGFAPPVFAQETVKTDSQNMDERQILAEIRTAKSFIENEDWEKARLKLTDIIRNFPQNRHLDIAYYWLAYSLFQEQKFSEAEQVIANLRSEFPNSAWIEESKSLLAEISSRNGRQAEVEKDGFAGSDNEAKAFAVQNMLKTNRKQAVSMIDEILAPGSQSADFLKESVLTLLFDDKSEWATNKFVQALKNETSEEVLKQALIGLGRRDEKTRLPVLSNFLRRNENENLLDAALYAVSQSRSETSIAALVEYAQNGGSDALKQKSIIWIGNIKSKRAVEELKKLYAFYIVADLKKQVQISLSEIDAPEASQALIDLIERETGKDLIDHGLELLKEKNEPAVLRYLEKKSQGKN